jgi:hypothetical protein
LGWVGFGLVWVGLGWVGLGWVGLGLGWIWVGFGSIWFGLVRFFWFGLVWFGLVRFGSVWFGSVRFGSVRFGSVWFGLVRFGSVWFGLVRLGLVLVGFGLGLVSNFEKNLVMVWFWFCDNLSVWFCFVPTEPENHFSKILQLFSKFFFSNFFKNMKIQYKSTFNQTKIRISQNLVFKNNSNIIFRQFENILYFEIFKCLVLGLVRFEFGLCQKNRSLVWFGSKFFVLGLVRFGLQFENLVRFGSQN